MTAVTAFAPATVSNVACGFDVLGFALEAPGDEVTARFADPGAAGAAPGDPGNPGDAGDAGDNVTIEDIQGDGGRLPRDGARNTAAVAVRALLAALGERRAVVLRIRKGLPLSSGLGGSAASAAAAVVAVDALLGAASPLTTLIACALEGERLGAGSAHADNIAPAICGGLVLVRCPSPPDVIQLPVPAGLTAVVVHPDLEIETAKARALLGTEVPLKDAVQQWANLGALVHGLHTGDFAVIRRSLEDTIAEPRRASLVPGLAAIKRAAVGAGALGCSLSGSGPSLFALCQSHDVAVRVAAAMTAAVAREIGGESQTYVSAVARRGARVIG
jgi:homoserine kinase